MGFLIAIAVALLAAVLLFGLAGYFLTQIGLLALAILAAAAIGLLWVSAAIGFVAFLVIVQVAGEHNTVWALAGAVAVAAVAWLALMRGVVREVRTAPERWRRFLARSK